MTATQKVLRIEGADGQPVIIPEREWYLNAKARPRRLMKVSLSSDCARLYGWYDLSTMGFQSEIALKMVNGKQVPATPSDSATACGLSKQNWRRAQEEYERAGLGERREIVPGKGLTKGNIQLCSWGVPRKPKEENGSRARLPFWESLDPEFTPLIAFAKRWKITPDENIEPSRDYLSQALEAVAQAEEAQKVACAIVERVIAPSRIYKEERNGKELERNPPPPQPFVNGSNGRAATVEEEEEEPASLKPPEPTPRDPEPEPQPVAAKPPQKPADPYAEFKSAYPPGHFDEAKAKPLFKALPKPTQQRVLNRLRDPYLACERWKDQDGQWIPLASTFLRERQYDADPPPRLNGRQSENAAGSDDRILKLMRGET